MNTHSALYQIVASILRVALVAGLVGGGWSIYRTLPGGAPLTAMSGPGAIAEETSLLIILRRSPEETREAATDIPVEMYQTDISAVWREYSSEPRPGVRFEDFLARHLKGRPAVAARLDQQGRATVKLAPGRWLLRALVSGPENIEWRLPVNIAGRSQTVELTAENSYARTKSF